MILLDVRKLTFCRRVVCFKRLPWASNVHLVLVAEMKHIWNHDYVLPQEEADLHGLPCQVPPTPFPSIKRQAPLLTPGYYKPSLSAWQTPRGPLPNSHSEMSADPMDFDPLTFRIPSSSQDCWQYPRPLAAPWKPPLPVDAYSCLDEPVQHPSQFPESTKSQKRQADRVNNI